MSYFEIFQAELIKHSKAENYYDACHEWDYMDFDIADDDEECYCICSHPIKQLITIHNRENGNKVIVGSDCILKIAGFPNADLYQPVISNLVDLKNNPNDTKVGKKLIDFIRLNEVLEEKHIIFLEAMRCKRKFSPKQDSYYSGLKKKLVRLLCR